MLDWLRVNWAWVVLASAGMFLASLVLVPILIARMSHDYFVKRQPSTEDSWRARHPAIRLAARLTKNVLGVICLLLGLAMSAPGIPGQGILTILVGLTLVDFPGKRRIELWIVRRRTVRATLDWIRRRAGRPPLTLPD